MDLLTAIREASEWTRRLMDQLESDDQQAWEETLGRRATAMEMLEDVHRKSSPSTRTACREELRTLRLDDERLREKSDQVLGKLALEIRESMGMPSYAGHAGSGEDCSACLDRKA